MDKNYKLKINKVISILKEKKVDLQVVTASENIAWLLNIRGQDSEFVPIPNAYLTINKTKEINLFCDLRKIDLSFKKKFKDIKIVDIKKIDFFLSQIKNKKISIDPTSCSIYFQNILKK